MTAKKVEQGDIEPLLVDNKGLAKMLGVTVRRLSQMQCDFMVPAAVLPVDGGRWSVAEIEAWVTEDCPEREWWDKMRGAFTKPTASSRNEREKLKRG